MCECGCVAKTVPNALNTLSAFHQHMFVSINVRVGLPYVFYQMMSTLFEKGFLNPIPVHNAGS